MFEAQHLHLKVDDAALDLIAKPVLTLCMVPVRSNAPSSQKSKPAGKSLALKANMRPIVHHVQEEWW